LPPLRNFESPAFMGFSIKYGSLTESVGKK
jgi:hypothetical protein